VIPAAPRRGRGAIAAAVVLALAAGVVALGVVGAARSAPSDEKAAVDRRLARAQDRLRQARDRESVLTGEVQGYTDRIRVLEARLAPLRARSERLDAELASLRARLDELNVQLAAERRRLAEAEADLARRRLVLGRRLREIYVREDPDPILVLLESGSISAAIDTTELLQSITHRDGNAAQAVERRVGEVRRARDHVEAVRAEVSSSEQRAEVAASAAREARAGLETRQAGVSKLLSGRQALLAGVKGDRRNIEAEAEGLASRSQKLADRIRAAQGLPPGPSGSVAVGAPSAAGLVWPVNGPITSGFGMRWGRMHEGIDIAGSSGTPIAAAAAGTVIVAGWVSGYGNMVVIDHGGGISTGYGHLSSLAVSVGQSVGQGTVVGGMGTTGHSTGVHLHFEVRVNGTAVNPLGYL
jgi:murein DD-endopeptidase MepM/ murein hydrolase activator NlpD